MATAQGAQAPMNRNDSSTSSSVSLAPNVHRPPGELAISPAVEMAMTEIRTAAQLAFMMPRDVGRATDILLDLCEDPVFADEAIWEKKQGKRFDEATGRWVDNYIEGFSIRFVEEAIVTLHHFRSTVSIVVDTPSEGSFPGQRVVAVSVWDCQSNASHSDQVHITKIVERSSAQYRESDIAYERINSEKKTVFGLHATHAEVKTMQAAEVSKMVRTLALRLIPSKLKRVCYQRCHVTMLKEVQQDLPKYRKNLLTAFAGIKVSREMVEDYLGHSFDSTTAEQITSLQNVGKAIKAGETTWKEFSEPVIIDDDGNEVEPRQPKAEPVRSRTTRKSDAAHTGKAGTIAPAEQPVARPEPKPAAKADDVTVLFGEIDDLLSELCPDGDGGMKLTYEATMRKTLELPEGDLTPAQWKTLRDGLKKALADRD